MANPLKICDLMLRDGHQSLLATRMRTDDMLPIAPKIDQVGFWAVEMWGGATFDSAMRFLDENPWDRIRRLKAVMPNTPFLMLLRGQNVVGYKHYPDDVLERFIVHARANGIDIFRIFDALNDVRNMRKAMEIVKREGGHVQAAVSYTIGPPYSVDYFVRMGHRLADMGADTLCIKDMAGLITPYVAYELVRRLKEELDLPILLHSHATSGMSTPALLKAAEAGVDIVDTTISSLSLTTSHSPTESIVASLEGTERDTGLDLNLLAEIAAYFAQVRRKYARFESGMFGVDVRVLQYQIPGGMLSNLVSQLREQGAEEKYMEVLEEVPRVRREMGYPPLVTPSSQIVGTQATLNVVLGERYKVHPLTELIYQTGCYGRKTGSGYFDYSGDKPVPNPKVQTVIQQYLKDNAVTPKEVSEQEIVDVMLALGINEAALMMEEGICDRPQDMDLAMIYGTGFPPYRGGILRYADKWGLKNVYEKLLELEKKYGLRFQPAKLIKQMAESGKTFYGEQG